MKPKIYIKIVSYIILYIVALGFVCPYLISANDYFLPLLGVGIILFISYLFINQLIKLFKLLKNYENEKND
jgi:hypothetical protein